jgi:RNA polymerase sigma factor (sigma-70 family)
MSDPCPNSGNCRPLPATCDRDAELVALVHAVRAGDSEAWTRLVQRFDRMLRHIARSYRLTPADADDVVQTTWLGLFEAIDQIREPAAVGAWLATSMRRASLRRIQAHVREQLTDDPQLGDRTDGDPPEAVLLARERRNALDAAIAGLPDRQRDLVSVLLTQPALGYREIGELISMPTGSIGPIRARSLARLARDTRLRAVSGPH